MRHKWNSDQLQPKRNSKILISVNPDRWEGDYRIWDGFSSGALVFIDPLFVPSPFPFIDGQHVIFYNPHNQSEFIQKVEYYLNHPEEARVIAERGYLHAMRFHRSVNLVDYILISAHLKKVAEKNERLSKMSVEDKEVEKYRYTAQDLLMECRVQGPMVRTCQRPPLLPQPHEVQASRRLQC